MFLSPKRLLLCRKNFGFQLQAVANYSRKSDSKNFGFYKIVKSNDVMEDFLDSKFGTIPNWELLAPRGYRFLLPGSLGPAWHESGSMGSLDEFYKYTGNHKKSDCKTLECSAQECPTLLKKGVLELFPGSEASKSQQITVVTLTYKKEQRRCNDSDTESEINAKQFIWTAHEICMKLKMAGYWADFINPFSGKPYVSSSSKPSLYETDERFRCTDFEIKSYGDCKVIQSRKGNQFRGSLFTNAPASVCLLYELINDE